MVDIQSKEVIDKISDELKIQPAMAIPKAIAEKIQLSYEVNPRRSIDTVRLSTSAGGTIFTTPTSRDFFLTNLSVSGASVAVSAAGSVLISGTPKGAANVGLIRVEVPAVVTGNSGEGASLSITLNPPLLLERNTALTLTVSIAAAKSGIIMGYMTDPQ